MIASGGLGILSRHCGYGEISVALCFLRDVEFGLSEGGVEVFGGQNLVSAVRLFRPKERQTNRSRHEISKLETGRIDFLRSKNRNEGIGHLVFVVACADPAEFQFQETILRIAPLLEDHMGTSFFLAQFDEFFVKPFKTPLSGYVVEISADRRRDSRIVHPSSSFRKISLPRQSRSMG